MRRLLLAWLLSVASACALAQAESRSLTCDRDADDPLRPVVFAVGGASAFSEAEHTCWLDWTAAQQAATGPGGQWVDVRDAGARRLLTLPGVTAVDLADLPSKAFLKGQSLVLIGTGVDLKTLSTQCVALRQSDQFKDVHVLLHGVRAWRLAKQPTLVDGSVLAPDEVSAQELWLGAADDQWRIAAIGLAPEHLASLPVKAAFTGSEQNLRQTVAELATHMAQNSSDRPQQRWLALTATAAQLAQLRALWLERPLNPADTAIASAPLWLVGAWPAYASYLEQQKTLAAHAGRPLPRLCGM
jgi:hypothetical protein